jgi:hypothetical protein
VIRAYYRWWALLLLLGAAIAVFAIIRLTEDDDSGSSTGGPPSGVPASFPDYGYLPAGYKGPTFRLSQDYPKHPPKGPLPRFFKTDFRRDWKTYLLQARSYCFAGMTDTDWRPEENHVRRWYNMPWQHYGQFGREGIHGLTKEAPIQPKQLARTQTLPGVTYAVAFYNAAGGYAIGRVWRNHNHPDPSYTTKPKPGFPNGTVVCKILFANLPTKHVVKQVPFFVHPIQWDAYVTKAVPGQAPSSTPDFDSCLVSSPSCRRAVDKVTLIQMDIMVKDDRAPTSWLFGTFQYNGALNHANRWDNLAPLGLMWGNDPENNVNFSNPTPTKTVINPAIKESIINPDTTEIPPTHLGWNSRLDGPVDDPQSSCMSCHMTAEYPATEPIMPRFAEPPPAPGSKEWMRWFQTLQCTTPFATGSLSTDDSLQLSQSIENFYTWLNYKDGVYASPSQLPAALRIDTEPIARDLPKDATVRSHVEKPKP